MNTLKHPLKYFFSLLMILNLSSCELEEELTDDEDSVELTGVWVRTLGASGDKTDLAIGVITGEATRVFMCEKRGSTAAGFYKGNLYDNTIVWDATYGLPDTRLRMVGTQLEFSYPSVAGSLPTLYNSGSWSAECGPLSSSNTGGCSSGSSTTGKASLWVTSDLGWGNITVVLNDTSSSTISQFYSNGSPGCDAGGSANFELPSGTYNYTASCSGYTWNGTITITNGQCSTMQLYL